MTVERPVAVDAGLALLALVACLVLVVVFDVSPAVGPALVGAVGALALELLLERRHGQVRRLWGREPVKIATVFVAAVVGGALVRTAPEETLSAVAGGLVAYLALLGLVQAGVVAAPRNW